MLKLSQTVMGHFLKLIACNPETRFSKVPKLFGLISLCIFKTKASRGTKRCNYFYSLYNIIMKKPALRNKQLILLGMAFRAENGPLGTQNTKFYLVAFLNVIICSIQTAHCLPMNFVCFLAKLETIP